MDDNLQTMSEAVNAGLEKAGCSADEFAKAMNDVQKLIKNLDDGEYGHFIALEQNKIRDNICNVLHIPKTLLYDQNEIKYPGGFSNQPSITKLAKAFDRFEHPPYIFDEVHEYDPHSTFIFKKIEEAIMNNKVKETVMNNYEKIKILGELAKAHEPVIFQDHLVGYIQDMNIRYGGEALFTIEMATGPWDQTETIKDVRLEDIRMPYFANHARTIPDLCIIGGRRNGKTACLNDLLTGHWGVQSESHNLPEIKNVDYQYKSDLTVVIWEDGTKTFVKCKDEIFDEEKALAMAIAKKAMGNEYKYFKKIKKWLPKIENDE